MSLYPSMKAMRTTMTKLPMPLSWWSFPLRPSGREQNITIFFKVWVFWEGHKICKNLRRRASCSVCATAYLSKSRQRFLKTNMDKSYYTNFKIFAWNSTSKITSSQVYALHILDQGSLSLIFSTGLNLGLISYILQSRSSFGLVKTWGIWHQKVN